MVPEPEVKAMIRQGRVTVDGTVVKKPEQKVSSEQDVCADGTTVRQLGTVVLMLHKPSGYVTSTSDPRDQTVMELLPAEYQKLFPVGRLDRRRKDCCCLPMTESWGIGLPVPDIVWKRNITLKQTAR